MSIRVSWEVTTNNGIEYINFEDLGISKEEFTDLPQIKQEELIYNYLDKLDRVQLVITKFKFN